jgi:AraC family transcriptional regulator of adaptative response/methylated-DNA-[protein]-cysteine methyltransferase
MSIAALREKPPTADTDPRWPAIVSRDPAVDGQFFYSVRTTGVYCRPSCGSRRASPKNVAFHETAADAERAGFRPCKRCKPDQASLAERNLELVTAACRVLETAETTPTLEQLAGQFDTSPYHFHRVFKSVTGLTPRQYASAHRERRVRERLVDDVSVTDAIFDAGYNSNSRFYERADDVLGMTPTEFRDGGSNAAIRFAVGECSLGAILVACSARGVCAILIGNDPDALARDLQDQFPQATLIGGDREFEALVARVVGFVEAPSLGLDLPLDVRGTAFQRRVWEALRDIPCGETASYSDVALRIGAPKSARAVARACAANVLAVAIPCHRVVRSDGGLSGYRWGVERKRVLLEQEANG